MGISVERIQKYVGGGKSMRHWTTSQSGLQMSSLSLAPLLLMLVVAVAGHAQEVDPHIRVVDSIAPGDPCPGGLAQGQCWENAFANLQDALDAVTPQSGITEIWVAAHPGNGYVPSAVDDPDSGGAELAAGDVPNAESPRNLRRVPGQCTWRGQWRNGAKSAQPRGLRNGPPRSAS
jgi:hypothetical protein